MKNTDWFIVISTGGLGLVALLWLSSVFGRSEAKEAGVKSCSDAVQLCVITEGAFCSRVDELCTTAPKKASSKVIQLEPIVVIGNVP